MDARGLRIVEETVAAGDCLLTSPGLEELRRQHRALDEEIAGRCHHGPELAEAKRRKLAIKDAIEAEETRLRRFSAAWEKGRGR